MSENDVVRPRIDEAIKNEAVAADRALPFEPLVPNVETIEAMLAARRGELIQAGHPEKLLANLNAEN